MEIKEEIMCMHDVCVTTATMYFRCSAGSDALPGTRHGQKKGGVRERYGTAGNVSVFIIIQKRTRFVTMRK